MRKCCKGWLVVTAVSGFILLIMTCTFDPFFQAIVHAKMRQMLAIKPNGYSYDYWVNPPVPVLFRIFVFDVANPEEILQGQMPKVIEKGPYTYRVKLEKFNITFHDNHTVSYRQRQTFTFDRDLSVGWANETFTTPNAPLFTTGAIMEYQSKMLQEALNLLMETLGEKPFIELSVHDVFWGYKDRFLELAKDVLDEFHMKSDFITGIFGYYMGRNNTDDGMYNVHTGTDDLSKFLIIDKWNRSPKLSYWSSPQANMINGTDGSLYPPFVTRDRTLQMYDSNLYRSMSMVYHNDTEVLGVPTMRFLVEDKEFANETVNPANAGFCTPLHNCIPSGVINGSASGHGAPLYVSMPHFLGADPYYFTLVEGLHPDRAIHQAFFDLHELTGVCLHAGRRYQLNLQTKEYPFLSKTRGIKLAYVPVLWLDGEAKIDDTIGSTFRDQIETPLRAVKYFRYSLFGIGPLMLIIPIAVLVRDRRKQKKEQLPNGLHPHNVITPNGTIQYGYNAPSDETPPDETSPLLQ